MPACLSSSIPAQRMHEKDSVQVAQPYTSLTNCCDSISLLLVISKMCRNVATDTSCSVLQAPAWAVQLSAAFMAMRVLEGKGAKRGSVSSCFQAGTHQACGHGI